MVDQHARATGSFGTAGIAARRADVGFYGEYAIKLPRKREDNLAAFAPKQTIYGGFAIKPVVRSTRSNPRRSRQDDLPDTCTC
jgi:hypothetical protein